MRMKRVIVTGVAGSVGSRVARYLTEHDQVGSVVGVDIRSRPDQGYLEIRRGDLRHMDLVPDLRNADVLVHLASAFGRRRDGTDVSPLDTASTKATFAAAQAADCGRVIVLSSAMVYGAWPTNPLPLTEQAPLRPNPGFRFAAHKAEVERLAAEWKSADPSRSAAILRPTTAVASGESSWVARTLRASAGLSSDKSPPVQFLHLDDLARAVVVAVTEELDGPYNVSPDGWSDGEDVRQLLGRAPRLRLSSPMAGQIAEAGWRHQLAPTPPGILPYATHAWVVANDRLRAAGWEPEFSTPEAFVEGHDPRPWAMVSSRQRQQLAMGGMGAMGVAGLAAARIALRLARDRRP